MDKDGFAVFLDKRGLDAASAQAAILSIKPRSPTVRTPICQRAIQLESVIMRATAPGPENPFLIPEMKYLLSFAHAAQVL